MVYKEFTSKYEYSWATLYWCLWRKPGKNSFSATLTKMGRVQEVAHCSFMINIVTLHLRLTFLRETNALLRSIRPLWLQKLLKMHFCTWNVLWSMAMERAWRRRVGKGIGARPRCSLLFSGTKSGYSRSSRGDKGRPTHGPKENEGLTQPAYRS